MERTPTAVPKTPFTGSPCSQVRLWPPSPSDSAASADRVGACRRRLRRLSQLTCQFPFASYAPAVPPAERAGGVEIGLAAGLLHVQRRDETVLSSVAAPAPQGVI